MDLTDLLLIGVSSIDALASGACIAPSNIPKVR